MEIKEYTGKYNEITEKLLERFLRTKKGENIVLSPMSVKSVLDTPLLTDDGLLTEESEGTASNIEGFLENMRISI